MKSDDEIAKGCVIGAWKRCEGRRDASGQERACQDQHGRVLDFAPASLMTQRSTHWGCSLLHFRRLLYTTSSSLGFDTFNLISDGRLFVAGANAIGQFTVGVAALYCG